ncbi:HAMP domain-containing sensor histidine kinase [Massilia sp. H6]|uniref:PAS domain-containing sensor histidine kinase n=1 Tax=Massilia sp. H6 TaxID=2970464 RepID=UPI0021672276|nr:HAMP domain-containing sensor histidine kinase [Massilia sp. H6]UVW28672.1 HAMP domain-containing histidine kinase [Massilia sp. H6]
MTASTKLANAVAAPDTTTVPGGPHYATDGAPAPGEQFRTIAELAGDIAFSIDLASSTVRYLSPSFSDLLGHPAGALQDALTGGGAKEDLGALAAHLASGPHTPGARSVHDVDVRNAHGHPVGLQVISVAMRNGDGSIALVGQLRDLTPQRAHLADQRRFASMLNHEFRTPLATIDGAIQRLESTSHGADDATRQRYRKIAVAADRLIAMLDEYLSPDRMAAIGKVRQPNTIAPADLLEAGARQVREGGREAVLDAGELPQALRGEPEGLRLALKVLVDNALLFSPPTTKVALGARRSGGGVEFTVRDEGGGVPPDDVERIFDKGYRGRNAQGLPGSGLGLYLARSIVDVHGGMLRLGAHESGAEFRLWLPALDDGGQQRLASSSPSSDNRTDE